MTGLTGFRGGRGDKVFYSEQRWTLPAFTAEHHLIKLRTEVYYRKRQGRVCVGMLK